MEQHVHVIFMFGCDLRIKSDGFTVQPCLYDLIQSLKCASADKQDIGRVDLDQFLMRMFSSALRRYRSNRSLDDLQKCLLHALAGNISCDRRILGFSRDLIDLVNINDAVLRAFNITVCRLDHFQQNILYIFADISSFRQCRRIRDRKRNI